MDYRLSYMESVEDNTPHELATSINPYLNLKDAFAESGMMEPSHLKVYLRIRPQLQDEQNCTKEEPLEILSDQSISMVASSHGQSHKNNTKISHNFTFSQVYGPESSQKVIFEQTTEELVKDVINGQNGLMFTYGATNSGKTFTIQGTEQNPGLLQRTLVTLFESVGSKQYLKEDLTPYRFCSVIRLSEAEIRKEKEIKDAILGSRDFSRVSTCSNFSYASCSSKDDQISVAHTDSTQNSNYLDLTQGSVSGSPCFAVFVSFAEIYNEYVYDLLERFTIKKNIKRTPLVLGEDKFGSIYIKGLKHIKVCSVEESLQVLEVGRQNLHFASTQLNQNSSRSHCIFTIKLVRLFDPSNPHLASTSMLSLCDLAGAERATKSVTSHDRLKEAGNINTSLLVLGRCIAALRHNQSVKHSIGAKKVMPVPYRDSKVTRLFQSFFMGKGLLAMIVNICTSNLLLDDTLKVLKFSAIARKVAMVPNKAYIDQHVEKQQCARSRFSRFMRHSLNMSKGSIRFSVPWANSTTRDVTFGAAEEETHDSTTDVTNDEEETHQEALLDLIKQLRDRLIAETKEKQDLEKNLRKELCDGFSQRLVEIQNSYTSRIEEQRLRSEALMDWRVNRALETTNPSCCRKRPRLSDDGVGKRLSELSLFQNELKDKEIQQDTDLLRQELEVVRATLKTANQSGKLLQEENSKLTFQLSAMTESRDEAEIEKDKTEKALHAGLTESQPVNTALIDRQQQRISSLLKDLEAKQEENNTVNLLLTEAAKEFIHKEQELKTSQQTLVQQNVILSEMENQLFEAKELVNAHTSRLEERERTIYELQESIEQNSRKIADAGTPECESDEDDKSFVFKEDKHSLKNRNLFLKCVAKNQSLIDFETSEKKINRKDLRTAESNKIKYLEECLSKSEEKCLKSYNDFKEADMKKRELLGEIEAKEKDAQKSTDLQKRVEELQIYNEELLQENATLKFIAENDRAAATPIDSPKRDLLSQSLINNESLSKCGEAPVDDFANLEVIEDLRLVLQSLKLNTVQELEQSLVDARAQLDAITKKCNETDEELVGMCKLNETLQNEVLSNRNKINYLESDLFGTKTKLTSVKQEFDSVSTYCRDLKLQIRQIAAQNAELAENKINLANIKELNTKLISEADIAKEKEATLTSEIKTFKQQLTELSTIRTRIHSLEMEKATLQEERTKLLDSIKSLENSLQDEQTLATNLTKKVETLDKKITDLESTISESEILSKQLVALRDARNQEIIKFESEMFDKDSEISALQNELKESIMRGEKVNKTATNIKQEDDSVQIAEEQLRQSELERSSLVSYVSNLEKQLADKSESFKELQAELSALSFNKKVSFAVGNDSQPQCFDEFVTPVAAARSTKRRTVPKDRTVQFTELENISHLEDSGQSKDCFVTPIPLHRKKNTRSSSKKQFNEPEEVKSKPRSTRAKRQTVTFNDVTETADFQQCMESSSEEAPSVETSTRRSTRKTRGRSRKNSSVPNPHIPDEKDKENVAKLSSENKRTTKRRRPLHNVADEQTLDGSPKLTSHEPRCTESPHTISRRQLRSKFK